MLFQVQKTCSCNKGIQLSKSMLLFHLFFSLYFALHYMMRCAIPFSSFHHLPKPLNIRFETTCSHKYLCSSFKMATEINDYVSSHTNILQNMFLLSFQHFCKRAKKNISEENRQVTFMSFKFIILDGKISFICLYTNVC